jgi:hypothetical protein
MDWIDVPRYECVEFGLISDTAEAQPAAVPGFNENLEMSPGIANTEILAALLESLKEFVTFKNGVLTFT